MRNDILSERMLCRRVGVVSEGVEHNVRNPWRGSSDHIATDQTDLRVIDQVVQLSQHL
jgi:hypothetical protein